MIEAAPEGSVMQKMLTARKELPDFLGFSIGQIYPNFLGWNFRAAIRNYFQPLLTTAPELGWGYGSKLVGKATMSAAADFFKAPGVSPVKKADVFSEFLQPKGLAPGKFFGEAGDVTGEGLRAIKGVGQGVEMLDKHNNAAMYLYGLSDNVNRYITYKVGHELARDIARGIKPAREFAMRTLSEGGKAEARKILRDMGGELSPEAVEKLGDALARNLITKTQFNYGKEALNEWGREHGRLFSMFTKWPAMILSDNAELIEKYGAKEGTIKASQRYLAPMAIMAMAGTQLKDTDSGYIRWLIGEDLSDAAPAQSIKVGMGPVFKTGGQAAETLLKIASTEWNAEGVKKSAGALGKLAKDTGMSYVPGMGAFNEIKRVKRAFRIEDEQ
jgi:hypothetical protein